MDRAPALHIILPLEGQPRMMVDSMSAAATDRLRDDLLRRRHLASEVGGLLDQIAELRSAGSA